VHQKKKKLFVACPCLSDEAPTLTTKHLACVIYFFPSETYGELAIAEASPDGLTHGHTHGFGCIDRCVRANSLGIIPSPRAPFVSVRRLLFIFIERESGSPGAPPHL
jgi:hypothetical protein